MEAYNNGSAQRIAMRPVSLKLAVLMVLLQTATSQYASFDQSGNNNNNPSWGSAGSPFLSRPVYYADRISAVDTSLPNARNVSNVLFSTMPFRFNKLRVSSLAAAWGQFSAHDMIWTVGQSGSPAEVVSIAVPTGDKDLDPNGWGMAVLNMSRTIFDQNTGTSIANPRRQLNTQTSFLDASVVYGTSSARAGLLRSFSGGELIEDPVNGMPKNNVRPGSPCVDMAGAHMSLANSVCGLRMAGDVRANVAPGILSLHGLMVKNHNWWARKLRAANPSWGDEVLFQEARKRVMAEMQSVTYNEYLPELMGGPLEAYSGYKPNVDPRVDPAFAIAAYRYGHSGIDSMYLCINKDGDACTAGHLLLRDVYFSPDKYLSCPDTGNGNTCGEMTIADLLRGQVTKLESMIDTRMVDDVRNFVEGKRADLAAFDIARARDFGLPSYVQSRRELGLVVPLSFSDITTDADVADKLAGLYGTVDKVDLWVGGLAEAGTSGKMVGETFQAIIRDQFRRTRDGDRFFYLNSALNTTINGVTGPYLTDDDRQAITTTRLADIIKRNTDFSNAPMSVFTYTHALGDASTSSGGTTSITTGGSTGTTASGDGKRRVTVNDVISLEWTPPSATDTDITLTFSFKGVGWLGMGLGKSMVGADIWKMSYSGGAGAVEDQKATAYVQPTADARQDVTLVSASQSGGTTTFTVKRALSTGDSADTAIVRGTKTDVIFAWDTASTSYGYHGTNKISGGSIDLFAAPAGNGTDSGGAGFVTDDSAARAARVSAYGFHGLSMFVSWGVLAPTASIGLHFFRHKPAAYAFHKWAGLVVTSLTLPAAGAAIVQSAGGVSSLVHANLGMVMASVLLVQIIMGASVRNWLRGDKVPPSYWYWIRQGHRTLGSLMLIGGFANCVLGADLLLGEGGKWALLTYFLILIIGCFIYQLYDETTKQKDAQPGLIKLDQDNARRFSMSTSAQSLTIGEVRENCRAGCRWVILGGYVYDVGGFIKNHPGGAYLLERNIGSDVSQFFYGREAFDSSVPKHRHSQRAWNLLRTMCVAALKQPLLVQSWADAPAMPEHEATEEWELVARTVLPGERRRPVVKLEFMHPAADATDPLQWKPSSFGRYMVVKAPTGELEAMLAAQDGNTVALRGERKKGRRGSGTMFSLDAILRPLGLQIRRGDRDGADYDGRGYNRSSSAEPHGRGGANWYGRPDNRVAPYNDSADYEDYRSPRGEPYSARSSGGDPYSRDSRRSGGRSSFQDEPYGFGQDRYEEDPRNSRSGRPSSRSRRHEVAPGSVTGKLPPLVKQASVTPYARARMEASSRSLSQPPAPGRSLRSDSKRRGREYEDPPRGYPRQSPLASFGPAVSSEADTDYYDRGRADRDRRPAPRGPAGRALSPRDRHDADRAGWADEFSGPGGRARGGPPQDGMGLGDDEYVERPYSIVRPGDKPGLIMYVRRYPQGLISRWLYSLTVGTQVTMTGPKGLGLHLDDHQGGVIVAVFQGTGVVTAFDVMQHIYAASEARKKKQGYMHKTPTWSREQFDRAVRDGRLEPKDAVEEASTAQTVESNGPAVAKAGTTAGVPPLPPPADPLLRAYGYQPGDRTGALSPAPADGTASVLSDDTPPASRTMGATQHTVASKAVASAKKSTAKRTQSLDDEIGAAPVRSSDDSYGDEHSSEDTRPKTDPQSRTVIAGVPRPAPLQVRVQEEEDDGHGSDTDGAIMSKMHGSKNKSKTRPRFKLVLLACFEHEDAIIEPEWLTWLDETCDDFELHINLSKPRDMRAVADRGLPRVTTGRLNAARLEKLLPPANLLTVSLCGTPDFVKSIRESYLSLGLPKSLLSTVG